MASPRHASDRLWRDRLSRHAVPPPPAAWAGLADRLDAEAPAASSPSRGRSWAAGGLLALGLTLAVGAAWWGASSHRAAPAAARPALAGMTPAPAATAPAPSGRALDAPVAERAASTGNPSAPATPPAGAIASRGPAAPAPAGPVSGIAASAASAARGATPGLLADDRTAVPGGTPSAEPLALAVPPSAEGHAPTGTPAGADASPAGSGASREALPPDALSATGSRRPAPQPAPPTPRRGLYGGLNAGVNLSALLNARGASPDDNLDPGTRLGHAFGASLGYRIDERWSVEADLLIDSRQGGNFASTMARGGEEIDVTKRVQLVYTQVPVTVRFGGLRPALYGMDRPRGGPATVLGLQYGLLRNSRLAVGDKPVSPDRAFNEHDLAVLLGADYDIAVGNAGFFTVGLRGSLGLTRTHLTTLDGVNRDKRNAAVGLRLAYQNWLRF
jgi:hypothetical protein